MGGTIENAIPLSPYPNIWSHWFTIKCVHMFSTILSWWIDQKFRWQNDEKNDSNAKTAWPEYTEPKSQLSHRELIILINGLHWSYFIVEASLYIRKSRLCGLHFF